MSACRFYDAMEEAELVRNGCYTIAQYPFILWWSLFHVRAMALAEEDKRSHTYTHERIIHSHCTARRRLRRCDCNRHEFRLCVSYLILISVSECVQRLRGRIQFACHLDAPVYEFFQIVSVHSGKGFAKSEK